MSHCFITFLLPSSFPTPSSPDWLPPHSVSNPHQDMLYSLRNACLSRSSMTCQTQVWGSSMSKQCSVRLEEKCLLIWVLLDPGFDKGHFVIPSVSLSTARGDRWPCWNQWSYLNGKLLFSLSVSFTMWLWVSTMWSTDDKLILHLPNRVLLSEAS